MRSIDDILAISAERKGSIKAVLDGLALPKTTAELASISDDRWLATMTRGVFQAGFNWKVVEAMWPGFEKAFHSFDPGWCAHIADERFDQLISNTAIVRHGPKINAVAENARFVLDKGCFGAWVSSFGPSGYAELLLALKSEGSRLGGTTGQYAMRVMGVDSFILSRDVNARLVAEGVVDKVTPSKKCYLAIQGAFDTWQAQSGYSLTQISRMLATSIG